MAEPRIEYDFERKTLYNTLAECVKICNEVLMPAFVEAGKGLHKWLEEHPNYGRN